jgi:hypothetical protein
MAYNESTIGGSSGGNFRVWINSIRTYDGNQSENFEEWRAEGGVNRISTGGGRIWNNYNNSTYHVQLGLNGVGASGNFSYDSTGTGRVAAWGTGTTRVYRDGAGNGFGFQSRMDINMSNSPYLTSGWVTSNDSVITRPRYAVLTALSTDAGGIPFTDEGPAWVEFTNPSGTTVQAFLEAPDGSNRVYTSSNTGSRHNFAWSPTLTQKLQQATPNSNSYTVRIGIFDGFGHYDYRDRTYTIKNDVGQANPVFTDFDYRDTNATTVAVTGDDQVLIQGVSTLEVEVEAADKAVPQKYATMANYNVTLGSYNQNQAFASSGDVTHTVGSVSDVTGLQTLGVRAVDSRGNGKTVSKNVTILPYNGPGFFYALDIKYANEFDAVDGLSAVGYDSNAMAIISPMTYLGTDKNVVNTTSGVKFDIKKGASGSFSGTWTNVTVTQEAGTGLIRTNMANLASAILTRMNALGADNTVPWFIKFRINDSLEQHDYTLTIDIGRPILRIGTDGNLYHKEVEFHNEFNPMDIFLVPGINAQPGIGTWEGLGTSGYSYGTAIYSNFSAPASGDYCAFGVWLNKGTYNYTTSMWAAPANGIVKHLVAGAGYGGGTLQFTRDCYNSGGNTEFIQGLNGLIIDEAGWYTFAYLCDTKNAASGTTYRIGVLGIRFNKQS